MADSLRRMIMLGGLALPFAALARGKAPAELDLPGAENFPDVRYSPISDSTVMDIYSPKAATSSPLVLYVHGGAFWGGDKRDSGVLNRFLPDLIAAGIAVAAVNYRLSGEAVWPAQREDLAAALNHLHDHAAEYGVNPAKLVVFGTSAGATLALIAGMDEVMSGRGAVKAIAAWFPATLFTEMDHDMALDHPLTPAESMAAKKSMISRLVGTAEGTDPAPSLQASPVTILGAIPQDQKLPPFLLAAGQDDTTISWRQSQRFVAALGERATPPLVDWTLYPNSGHGSGAFRGEAIGHLVDFVKQQLAG